MANRFLVLGAKSSLTIYIDTVNVLIFETKNIVVNIDLHFFAVLQTLRFS